MNTSKNTLMLFLLLIPLVAHNTTVTSLTIAKPLTNRQILIKYVWQIDEVLKNSNGKNSHYLKGKINTTGINYKAVHLTFKKNGAGSYTTDLGQTFPANWKFTSSDEKNMEFTVNYYSDVITYKWNFVEISKKSLCNTTALSYGNSDLLVVARYVPL